MSDTPNSLVFSTGTNDPILVHHTNGDISGPFADCALILRKWHNWIATGQTDFRADILEESRIALEKLGLKPIHEDEAVKLGAIRR